MSFPVDAFFHNIFQIIDSARAGPQSLESDIIHFSELLQKFLEPDSIQYVNDSPMRNQILKLILNRLEQIAIARVDITVESCAELYGNIFS